MKYKKLFLISLTTLLIVILSFSIFTTETLEKGQIISTVLSRNLENFHFSEKKINDDFSNQAFYEYLKFLDPNKNYFLQEDIEELEKYKDKIDDYFRTGNMELLKLTSSRLSQRIQQIQGFYKEILNRPFDFSKDETIELDREKREYCRTIEELKEWWRKVLKNQTLIRYINLIRDDKKESNKTSLQKKAQQEVLKSLGYGLNRKLQTTENDALSDYLNSLLRVFDPHTTYFSPVEKQNFDLEMSGTFQGIGALLTEENGNIKVVRIIPGGPSWRQKKLEANDFILKVAQGDGEPVDIIGMRTIDAVKLIRGKKGTVVKLTVKKPDGRIMVIPIVRDVVVVEETYAKSAVIRDDRYGKNFGYILLRRFYNDFNHADGRNSAKDVKLELEKLKRKKINGLVLDLRSNSGGSLQDAIRITGLFITKGPIVQTQSRTPKKINIMKDPDPKIQYKGPLVVLLNRISASAAEILAAALQDYQRAVIIGGSHSYGKGTVQIMIDLNQLGQMMPKKSAKKGFGSLKITVYKFYRINGSSNQYYGVIPDITLPSLYSYLEIGEKYNDHSLKGDTINTAAYNKWQEKPNLPFLKTKSKERIQKSPYFQMLEDYLNSVKTNREMTEKSLLLAKALKEQKELRERINKLDKLTVEFPHLQIYSSQLVEEQSSPLSKIALESQKQFFSELKKDHFLNEAFAVLNDMITK